MIVRGTRVASKAALASLLQLWYRETTEERIGPAATYGGQPWVWVDLDPIPVKLNADTRREAVGDYLHDVATRGADASWHVVHNSRGKVNKVVYRSDHASVPGWYCYLAHAVAEPREL